MNFTLALLGGLTLILPGLVALMAVHLQSGRYGARRIDLPVTSTLGLVVVLGVSMLAHLLGWALFDLGVNVARELQGRWPGLTKVWGLATNPYEVAVRLAEGGKAGLGEIVGFLATVGAEAGLAVAIVMSRGFVLVVGGVDLGNQGWLFQKIILPIRHGLQPVAYVLTVPQSDGTGLGYRGVIVEARQNVDGELKGLTLNGWRPTPTASRSIDPRAIRSPVTTPKTSPTCGFRPLAVGPWPACWCWRPARSATC